MTDRVPRRVARPVGRRDQRGNGTTCTCRRRSRQLAGDYACVIAAGMAYGHREWAPRSRSGSGSGTGMPTSGSRRTSRRRNRPRCGSAGPRRASGDQDGRCVLARTGGARGPRRVRVGRRATGRDDAGRRPRRDMGRGLGVRIGRCWSIHFYAIRGPYQVLEDLADLYESVIEAPAPGEALGLIGGGDHELQAVERDLEALAAIVAADARPRRRRLDEPGVTVEALAALARAGRLRDGAGRVPRRARPPRPEHRRPGPRLVGRGARPAAGRARQAGAQPRRGRRRGTAPSTGRRGGRAGRPGADRPRRRPAKLAALRGTPRRRPHGSAT